jgi:hypothetical protein
MNRILGRLSAMLLVVAVSACASSSPAPGSGAVPAGGAAHLITQAEIERGQWSSVYELVRNLRPRWIRTRGPDSLIGTAGTVQVYIDGMRLGAVDLLRDVPTAAIRRMEWVDPVSAGGRFGPGHAHGVIAISYRSGNR